MPSKPIFDGDEATALLGVLAATITDKGIGYMVGAARAVGDLGKTFPQRPPQPFSKERAIASAQIKL
jgi:hypothetical protein